MVDPQSPLFQRVAATFDYFEHRRYLTVFQPLKGRLIVELRRLALSFSVNSRNLLESPQLKAEIDLNQDAGTWYGLDSKLVLKEVVMYVFRPLDFANLLLVAFMIFSSS